MNLLVIFLIAVSLSMDAFSLSLIYGVGGINKKDKILLSLIVGIYHFMMPLIGLSIGLYVTSKVFINTDILVGIILSLIAIEMLISSIKNSEEIILYSLIGYLIFGLSVSLDSLTTGIGLPAITDKYLIAAFIFSLTSFSFTYLGLNIGTIINEKCGQISKVIGAIILLIIGIIYIVK